jgi:mRNA-degrading endonuclease RelE of RelBE toxin-antitoxin system
MYNLHLHKNAEKAIQKFPKSIRLKASRALKILYEQGTTNFPFPIKSLQGQYKKFKYSEIKIAKDYRIIYRKENNIFYIRYAGTHNSLGTG